MLSSITAAISEPMIPSPGASPEARAAMMCTGAQGAARVTKTGQALAKAAKARTVKIVCFMVSDTESTVCGGGCSGGGEGGRDFVGRVLYRDIESNNWADEPLIPRKLIPRKSIPRK